MEYTAGDVMDRVKALLNDVDTALFDYDVQLPYLKIAQEDLEKEFVLNSVPLALMSEAVITVPAGDTELTLPASFFLPVKLQERNVGDTYFSPMAQKGNVNNPDRTPQGNNLNVWDYRHNCINFVGATEDREVRLTYWRTLPAVLSDSSVEYMTGGTNPLAFRTAALCAYYIGSNKERHDMLMMEWGTSVDQLMGIFIKNSQAVRARRKPFRLRGGIRPVL